MAASDANGRSTVGSLAIVLHSHMPYVESFGVWPFGEEWLWKATAECYLRVADTIAGHPVTVGITPVLADQFEAMRGAAGDRFVAFTNDSREYVFGEDMRSVHEVGRGDLRDALEPQLQDWRSTIARFEGELDRDLNGMFDDATAARGELIGGNATHAIMPLVATRFGADLQLAVGLGSHAKRFGRPRGIWLPECAYDSGVDAMLARQGVEYFCVDQSNHHGVDSLDNLEPVATDAGPVAVPIDWKLIHEVWHEHGYPAAPAYRSSFSRTIHALLPWANDGGAWNPVKARAQAEAHAAAFLRTVAARLEVFEADRGCKGTSVFAIDTELLGHWWYEGPWWLEAVLAGAESVGVELVTLGDAVDRAQPVERELVRASWGAGKSLETWDSPPVAEMAWQQRAAEIELLFTLLAEPAAAHTPAALRAARELLAMQSSDWSFIAKRENAGDYAAERFAGHLAGFERSCAALRQSAGSTEATGHGSPVEDPNVAGLAPGLSGEMLAALVKAHNTPV